MEKIVIEYYRGDESGGFQYVHCAEYESKQKLKDDLAFAVLEAEEENNKVRTEYAAWQAGRPTFDGRKSPAEREEKMGTWLRSRPAGRYVDCVKLAGLSIPLDSVEHAVYYTLDEWFQYKLAEG